MANGSYRDSILDNFGRALDGVSVTVKLQGTANLATIFSDRAGTALANPFTNEADGSFEFWADVLNRYDATFSKTGVTFDNTDRLDLEVTGSLSDNSVPDVKIATSGITTRSKLPAAVSYEDEGNIFTVDQKISKANPILLLDNTTAANVGGWIGAVSADIVSFRLNETSEGVQEDATKPSYAFQLENDRVDIDRKPPGGAYANLVRWDSAGKQVAGTVPLARMAGAALLDATTGLVTNSEALVVIQAVTNVHKFYIWSIRDDATSFWAQGTRVTFSETVVAGLHSVIMRGSTSGNDSIVLTNGGAGTNSAAYKVYQMVET